MGHSRNSNRRGKLRAAAGMAAGVFAIAGVLAAADPAAAAAPVQVTAPAITVSGATLIAGGGTWTVGDVPATPSFTYQWQGCTAAAVPVCSPIAGATAATYALSPADANTTIQVQVTATDSAVTPPTTADPTTVTSAVVGPFNAPAGAPTITGSAVSGQSLTGTDGLTGTPAPVVSARQWYRCTSATFDVATCTAAPVSTVNASTTTAAYVISDADGGFYLAYQVAGASVIGAATAQTVTTAPVLANTATPVLAGAATLNQPLVAGPGIWAGGPTTFTFHWQRCSSAASCGDIVSNADGQSYTVDTADVGATLRARVTATSAAGPLTVFTAQTARVSSGATNFIPQQSVDPSATQPGDSFNVTAPANSTPKVVKPAPKGILQFTPFPVVRLKGVLTTSGARITLLSVTAPKGVSVKVSCSGRGCPRTVALTGTRKSVTRVTGYQRSLRSGVKITVKVFRAGYRGKYTTITIRKGTSPARRDGCLTTSGRPTACQGG